MTVLLAKEYFCLTANVARPITFTLAYGCSSPTCRSVFAGTSGLGIQTRLLVCIHLKSVKSTDSAAAYRLSPWRDTYLLP
jgi:hypothetical protein